MQKISTILAVDTGVGAKVDVVASCIWLMHFGQSLLSLAAAR